MSEILSEWCLIYVLRADVDSLSLPYLCPRARLKLVRSFMKSARRQSESTLLENMPSSMWLACSYIESRRPRTVTSFLDAKPSRAQATRRASRRR